MKELEEVRAQLALAIVKKDWHRASYALDVVRALADEKPSGRHFAREPWEVIYPRWITQEQIAVEYGLLKEEGQPW